MDVIMHLGRMEEIANTQVRDEENRRLLLGIIENDRKNRNFSLEKYFEFYEELDKLGKVQLDIWKVDKLLEKFYGSLAVVRAAVRFKRGIKNK